MSIFSSNANFTEVKFFYHLIRLDVNFFPGHRHCPVLTGLLYYHIYWKLPITIGKRREYISIIMTAAIIEKRDKCRIAFSFFSFFTMWHQCRLMYRFIRHKVPIYTFSHRFQALLTACKKKINLEILGKFAAVYFQRKVLCLQTMNYIY